MSDILPFLKDTTFAPDVTKIMGDAYDRATRELHDRGQPALVQEIIAKRIIHLAVFGERDPQKMAIMALQSLGVAPKA